MSSVLSCVLCSVLFSVLGGGQIFLHPVRIHYYVVNHRLLMELILPRPHLIVRKFAGKNIRCIKFIFDIKNIRCIKVIKEVSTSKLHGCAPSYVFGSIEAFIYLQRAFMPIDYIFFGTLTALFVGLLQFIVCCIS